MSATTSHFEPPPLLFGHSPSPPFSPHLTQTLSSPQPIQMDEPDDVDMTSSLILPPQNHGDSGDGRVVLAGQANGGHTNTTDLSGDAVIVDAMDTTPDGTPVPTPALPRSTAQVSPPARGQTPQTPTGEVAAASESQDLVAETSANGTVSPPPATQAAAIDSAVVIEERRQSISSPDSPRAGTSAVDEDRIEEDSSDEDEGGQTWQPIQEDTSTPEENEMKEIEASREHSAFEHEYWEKKTFAELEDPEYRPGATGRIHWNVPNFNGTKENPNKELVMFSPTVSIGGFDWHIKFYPKGNDSDYLSVYIECASIKPKTSKKQSINGKKSKSNKEDKTEEAPAESESDSSSTPEPDVFQELPLPHVDGRRVPKRRGVAAQCSVVIYNPAEPKVNYHRTATHRYCPASPDWGWTRFHGPYYEIQHRHRGQRQALLRNDTLAFTGYIRLFEDDTDCLWEHPTRENPWDSLAMTGLQGLSLPVHSTTGGNVVSAVSTWLLLKPFRELLYECHFPEIVDGVPVPPKPMVYAFQRILYCLRTRPTGAGVGPVGLEDLMDAFEWYGIGRNLDKMDVLEVWEVLRAKLEDELQETPLYNRLLELFGPKRNRMTNVPTYKAPVQGSETMQGAIDGSVNLVDPAYSLPLVLQIELDRQEFNETSRTWKKISERVALEEKVQLAGTGYSLFGFVVHKENLQSGLYNSVLRPCGPGGKWFTYKDGKDDNHVVCIPKREAIDLHEGVKLGKVNPTAPVAYVVVYLRDDIAGKAFDGNEPIWEVPELILEEKEFPKERSFHEVDVDMESALSKHDVAAAEVNGQKAPSKPLEYSIFSSKAFLDHEGSGIIDYFNPKWGSSDHVMKISFDTSDSPTDARDKIASVIPDIKDNRQVKFWIMSAIDGINLKPHLLPTGKVEISGGHMDIDMGWNMGELAKRTLDRRLWVHVVDEADLPPLPKPPTIEKEANGQPVAPTASIAPADSESQAEAVSVPPRVEDTPMVEADGSEDAPAVLPVSTPLEVLPDDGTPPIPPPTDTEMGGLPPPILEELIMPSPPQLDLNLNRPPSPPPPAPIPVQINEVYFFLKVFDAETQTLKAHGSYMVKKTARVDHTLHKFLDHPKDKSLLIWEEDSFSSARQLRRRKNFNEEDIHDSDVIIAQKPLSDAAKAEIAARAAFADPRSYLQALAEAQNFPDLVTGHFTLDYFSSEYYSGSMCSRQPHGEGKKIYYNGDTYKGSFQLGQRHGHGIMTFQNGDTYEGMWENGMQHGNGTYVEKETGNTYVGGWKNDRRFGEGVTHWKVAQETERLCRICWEENAEAAFYDCGHVVACLGCARRVDVCPVCRKRVLSAMKLYYVS